MAQFSIPINDSEILILGGLEDPEPKVWLYNVGTDTVSSVDIQGAFNFPYANCSLGASVALFGHNKVVALILTCTKTDDDEFVRMPCLM